jgi:hypothetical protein
VRLDMQLIESIKSIGYSRIQDSETTSDVMFQESMDLVPTIMQDARSTLFAQPPRVSSSQVDEHHFEFVEDHAPLKLDWCLASASRARALWLGKPGGYPHRRHIFD